MRGNYSMRELIMTITEDTDVPSMGGNHKNIDLLSMQNRVGVFR